MTVQPLSAEVLRRQSAGPAFEFRTTAELEPLDRLVGQDRALEALEFGTAIDAPGFNIFVLGEEGTGRRTAVLTALRRHAAKRPVPDDWCYINNFDDPRRPRALRLPPGTARQLATHMEAFITGLSAELPRAFSSEEYQAQRAAILQRLQATQKELFEAVDAEAERREVAIVRTPQAVLLVPKRHGRLLSDEEIERLSPEERERYDAAREEIQRLFEEALRRFADAAAHAQEALQELNRRTFEAAVAHLLEMLRTRYRDLPQVMEFLAAVEHDLTEVIGRLTLLAQAEPEVLTRTITAEEFQRRYKVNVLVGHHDMQGAPVVEEPNPTFANLLGRIEHFVHQGVLATDFTMIRAGALLRANGGCLVLDALEVLRRPWAWDAFKRALKQRELRIEEPAAELGLITTVTLQPEPIPLDVKVVLLGPPILYYLLYMLDPDFGQIFKVKADFAPVIERTPETELQYARFVASCCRKEGLPHFDAGAVGALVEYGSRRAQDQTRLTARLGEIADLVREAGHRARERGADAVTREDVEAAIEARIRRANRLEEELHRYIRHGTLLLGTRGEAVGQINGLSVITLGDYTFAKPIRVTATASVGTRGVVNIEREAALSGPIHSKAVLILTGYLHRRYGGERPLVLSASLGFEQVYELIEGDSATAAELLALLSALSGLPLRQDLAITGSVNQLGEIQPIGGVSEKVEGFYATCRIQGLTEGQGVVIPAQNVEHLTLRPEVVAAVEAGRFQIYPVRHIDEAIELCFRRPAEEVHRAVEARLDAFVAAWRRLHPEEAGRGEGPAASGGATDPASSG
ncbi:MAG TPA: ATP-binding protein [Longimicrobiales bacterium]